MIWIVLAEMAQSHATGVPAVSLVQAGKFIVIQAQFKGCVCCNRGQMSTRQDKRKQQQVYCSSPAQNSHFEVSVSWFGWQTANGGQGLSTVCVNHQSGLLFRR